MMTPDYDVAIVGSGFAGSLLARLLAQKGLSVVLVEAGRHPRFALGESSTPLAAIALERMAHRFGVPDLAQFAAYGRWMDSQPELMRGLKRGFSFYGHDQGQPYRCGSQDSRRLLVAASPNDAIADSHWLRSDVDARLVQRAIEAGVQLLEKHRLIELTQDDGRFDLVLDRESGVAQISSRFVVDASGGGSAVATALGVPAIATSKTHGTLLYGHFRNVRPFASGPAGTAITDPYPEHLAANHHVFAGGWVYVLPFDDGRVSAGAVLEDAVPDGMSAAEAWQSTLDSLPSLADCFRDAVPVEGLAPRIVAGLRRRRASAAGSGWALLPHAYAFQDPMYSTGMAWSLLGVERLADVLGATSTHDATQTETNAGLQRYAHLLETEALHIEGLNAGARALYGDFDRFVEWSKLYFLAASYCEARQRFLAPPDAAWEGFLGCTDPELQSLFERATDWFEEELDALTSRWTETLRSRDVAGITTAGRLRRIPVDLEALIEAAPRLQLDGDALRAMLPRVLRGSRFGTR